MLIRLLRLNQVPMTTNQLQTSHVQGRQSPNMVNIVANHHSYPPEAGSDEGGAYSGDPEREHEFEDSEEGARDFSDQEHEHEYSNSEEGSNSPDPEHEEYSPSEE
jgi:hypothetical protein